MPDNKKVRRRPRKQKKSVQLKVFALGGLGEIGKNMYVFQYGDDILVVDAGLMFPDEEMLGIDFVIPDISYLEENREKIKGIIITHGHEDHIGALPFVLPRLNVPVYGTRLTLGMVRHKLQEAVPDYNANFVEVKAGEEAGLGSFNVQFVSVCHSIPDGVGLVIQTPQGCIVHTGDFKLDPTPIDGRLTDYAAFAEAGKKGVLLMLSDSTNAEKKGFTSSEFIIGGTLDRIFRLHRNKRIIIAAFASNLHRVQQVVDAASRFNRKVAFVGRSMINYVALARELGYLSADDKMIIPAADVYKYAPNQVIVMTTGSQGEPFSGLVLMSKGEHKQIELSARDVVAIFASPVPGNEKLVSSTINRLFACGCEVIYEGDKEIHVSGHAARDELRLMINLVRPKYFVPIHGEYRHLVRHTQIAQEMGISPKNTFVLQNGDVLAISGTRAQVREHVAAGRIMVDGVAMGELEGSIMKERHELAEDGFIVVSAVVDKYLNLLSIPYIESRGFIHIEDASSLHEDLLAAIKRVFEHFAKRKRAVEKDVLELRVKSRVRDVVRRRYVHARPMILPIITMVEERPEK